MSDDIIEIKGLAKQYKIRQSVPYLVLRDVLVDAFKYPFRMFDHGKISSRAQDNFWALRDVSFNVRQGEAVGIIGRNGAGKTTLLKILSRITYPTKGEIKLKGRVASLLEVGTGFHPELTGRENIYFNGSILGMKKKEIDKKFDDIVAFSEVEKFLDTPVKRFSSGMQMRLAFAVAAHLEPEILLVDEVLAVGDIAFQKKCLGKMDEVAKAGRTVLFVSHNMGAVSRLCSRVILLQEGVVIMDGPAEKVMAKYMGESLEQMGQQIWNDTSKAPGNNIVRIRSVRVLNERNEASVHFDVRDPIKIEVIYWVLEDLEPQCVTCIFYNEMGKIVFISKDNLDSPWKDTINPKGLYCSVCYIPRDLLNDGMISVTVIVEPMDVIRRHPRPLIKDAVVFYVGDRMDPEGVRGNYPFEWERDVAVRPRLHWHVEKIS